MPASGELTADFALPRAVVVSGTGRRAGDGPSDARHSKPGLPRAWRRHGRPRLVPSAGGERLGDRQRGRGLLPARFQDQRGLFVGLVESDGVFRGVVPPGPGVLLLEASPGMPFMWDISSPSKESDGYHKRFPYCAADPPRAGRTAHPTLLAKRVTRYPEPTGRSRSRASSPTR